MTTRNRLSVYLIFLVSLICLTGTIYALNLPQVPSNNLIGTSTNSIAILTTTVATSTGTTTTAPYPHNSSSASPSASTATSYSYNSTVNEITNVLHKVMPIVSVANTIPTAASTLSIGGCERCIAIANAPSAGGLNGFVGNSTLTEAIATIVGNSTQVNSLIEALTPDGFVSDFNTSSMVQQNASTYVTEWTATGNVTGVAVDIRKLRAAVPNNGLNASTIDEAERAALPFINITFNGTGMANETKIQIMHITDVINGTRTVAKYIRTNITTYQSEDGAVVSISNMLGRVENKISLFGSPLPMRNITISTKGNLSTAAIAVKSYPGSSNTMAGRRMPDLPGNVMSYLQLNSTVNESSINYVNYTFNVTQAWLNDNKISPLHLSLYRLNATAGNWTKLPTILIGANATAYIYRAESPGMSIYAIAFSPVNITTASLAITITPQNILNGSNSTGLTMNSQQLSGNLILILAIVVAIVILVLCLYLKPPISLKPTEQKMPGDDSPIKMDYNS